MMEPWINRVLAGCGVTAGLLLGTEHLAEGVFMATGAIGAAWFMRLQAARRTQES